MSITGCFQEYEQEKCGEPMVSQKKNEGAQLVAAEENFAGHRDYKIFKCPKCGQKLRVPRHKGKDCDPIAENAERNLSARPDRTGRITNGK